MAQSKTTNKLLKDVLNGFLSKVQVADVSKVLDAWEQMLPEHYSGQTKAVRCLDGVLTVSVFNSSLYSVLSQYEKKHLLEKLQKRFPSANIKHIHFKMG